MATFEKRRDGFIYARFAHPTGEEVERRLAAVQGAESAALCASGMAAISLAVLAHCRAGDHILASHALYGGTTEFLKTIAPSAGLEVTFAALEAFADPSSLLRPATKLVFLESPSNPLMRLADFGAMFAGLPGGDARPLTVLDATLATPLGQDAMGAGFDLVVHSGTKYIGGHDDLTAGIVLGRNEVVEPVRERRRILGANCDPQTAWLLERGLRTLAVRWERQCANALFLAGKLEGHPRVDRVFHLGLPSHTHHELARRQMTSFGAVLAFEVVGGLEGARTVFDGLRLVARAPSLGGVDTMVLHPATASHRGLSAEELEAAGITDGLLRVSAGIEDPEDLWGDLEQALGG